MKKVFAVLLALVVAGTLFAAGGGQSGGGAPSYPTRPIQCIIPYPPGGGSDVLTRAIMKDIKMAQPLVAINVEGGAGLVGAQQAYDSRPDGYTILAHNPVDVMGFDLSGLTDIALWRELETVAMVVTDYNVICTNRNSGWRSLEDAVAWIKANPNERVRWGVSGQRSINMVDSHRVARALGIFDNIVFVPFDGGAGTRRALLSDEVRIETTTVSEIVAVAAAGDNVPLLVIGPQRAKSQPNVPCTVEKGINVTTIKWRGYYAPKGTPKPVLA